MRGFIKSLANYGLWIQAAAAVHIVNQPSVKVTNHANLAARQTAGPSSDRVVVAAIIPTQSGQIGINPPGPEPTPVDIEAHTRYLTEEGGTTKWIGVDPNYIAVTVVTKTKEGGETVVATITKGVTAQKNGAGGLSILLSPAVKGKLEAIAQQVTPCASKRRRQNRKRQGGPSCGLADFVQRVGADAELQGTFAEPLTDQVWHEIDQGYESGDPTEDPGWEGDGGNHGAEDEGYFSDDEQGFFEADGAEEGEVETIVFSTEEEAAAIGEALSGAGGVGNAALWGGSTVTAGSFLAWIWGHVLNGKEIPNAHDIPAGSIHRVTKTKTSSSTTTTTTTSSASCSTGAPPACNDCKPTSVQVKEAKATGVVNWVCSEGKSKDCTCDPEVEDAITLFDVNFNQAILEAIDDLSKSPEHSRVECSGRPSNVPSEFFVNKTSSAFCEEVMQDLGKEVSAAGTAYDINGNKIPRLKMNKAMGGHGESKRSLLARAPPESPDNYLDYRFFMSYTPKDRACVVPKEDLCSNAYAELVKSNCGTNHGSAGNRMFYDASIDVGCGKFTWKVEKPAEAPPKPTLGERECHDKHSHHDVHDEQQDSWSATGCTWFAADQTMKAGDEAVYWHPIGLGADFHQNYKISWIDGCETGVDKQSLESPIEGDDNVTCTSIMRANYVKCNNGGAGGSVDAGCLRYDFYVTKK